MKNNKIFYYLLAGVLGIVSIVLPTLFMTDLRQYNAPLFPIIRTAIEGISTWSFGLLLFSGFCLKWFSNLSSWKIGFATLAFFPIMAVLEIFVDSSSHNMLPFEFILYAVYSIPAIAGAYLAKGIKLALGNK